MFVQYVCAYLCLCQCVRVCLPGLLSAKGPEAESVIKAMAAVVEQEQRGEEHGFGASAFPVTMTGCFFCSS